MKDNMEKMADRLVERGFASSYVIDDTTRRARFRWTRKGQDLGNAIHHLFGLPDIDPTAISHADIIAVIGIFLFNKPDE